jgi:DNA (cytosine-5)-methyltransferase 1
MRYLSVCSGIEAATVAWHHMGWTPVAFSDIEPFPSAVLAHHYPSVPNLGDMTKFEEWNLEPIDLLVGGTPCQSFSVAGLRKGLEDPRGNLMLTYLAIARRYRPRWLVWENVPGVLSSNGGRDFGTFLGALGELGYGFAYRVLDAQWFGVAQRRRRVFVVGHLGDWRRAAAVLFERESVRRDTPPSRKTRKDITGSTGDGVARCITTGEMKRQGWETCNMVAQPIGFGAQMSEPQTDVDLMQTLNAKNPMAVAQPVATDLYNGAIDGEATHSLRVGNGNAMGGVPSVMQPVAFQPGNLVRGAGSTPSEQVFPTLKSDHGRGASDQQPHVMAAMQVRRLTPVECERLQGFPDNYTNIPWRKKPEAPDGPRYKALGNSMAVPVMRWIGERINRLEVSHPSNSLPSVAVKTEK